ncbi:uncharacterized protein A1O9_12477 [Exophiala aquamarina CBS 119918]|uniref:BTB domain-containing protein n=1 Tax=Exophiala aquamarina CBS 119918 TaxID=1182545 RepID=A0A072P7G9_9EURO|nr:uncharacterized protein A1O9_12477 [Exophiala aquamarina CBS 119918]KEF51560.1 hypothetical protein A1O9_12477 [Exophiala aquamarina CBS 119918]
MSHNLWRFLFEDDVESFRQYLANATFSAAPRGTTSSQHGGTLRIGSPGNLASSPKTPLKLRKSSGHIPTSGGSGKNASVVLTRAEVNARDSFGRTILHHAASSRSNNALAFVMALLNIPFLDIYIQDAESGWTALHRALYCGNITVAHALMARDIQAVGHYSTNSSFVNAGGLVKIKDHEGNSPFEVFGLTIAPRTLDRHSATLPSTLEDDDSVNEMDVAENDGSGNVRQTVRPSIDLAGDEAVAFGSNKNLSLGLGDEDDRHFPERIQLTRPTQLLDRMLEDHLASREESGVVEDLASSTANASTHRELPAVVRHRPITIQNVVMAKLHTAVLTADAVSNLYICGFGSGGRLGTGDENTCFTYHCIQAGGLAKRHISTVALGQDHTIAVCSQGEVYTWGSNRHGQLGYALPEVAKNEIPTQLVPRQLYGYIKKESIIGAAASSIHSVLYASNALYTFGKNEGQLGLMDADARSLETQVTPRRIGASLIYTPIKSVSAIDRATIVLLDNHDVIVFTHYGYTRVPFPLETFTNYYMAEHLSLRYNLELNYIKQITGGGNTICAMSSYGEVYTIEVPKVSEAVPSGMSTTNPTKARNALPQPSRLWSIRKAHMSAIDVDVGQDGSIILCTASGSVWRKEKRAKIKVVRERGVVTGRRPKDYKFVRIPHLTRAIAVRSNAFGAFAAVRKDCTVTREQIIPEAQSLWNDVFPLLPFAKFGISPSDGTGENDAARISQSIITSSGAEVDIANICKSYEPLSNSQYDLWVTSNVTDVRFPVHSFLLKARSRVMRSALTEFQETYYYTIPDVMSIEYGPDGDVQLSFQGADFLTLANFVFYLYTENVIDVWHYTSKALPSATRYRSVRLELMKIANQLELSQLERAVRVMVNPARCLHRDMELAILDPDFYSDADVIIELADGAELPAHSSLLCIRCPFFDGLFNGRAGGRWVASRRHAADDRAEPVRVDLNHIDERIFSLVLRYLYADTGEGLFDSIATSKLDQFIDILIELISAANELMLDRLAQICQQVIGKYVTIRNVCSLVNVIAECSVDSFKRAALEFICLNLEIMLELRLLDELDEELFDELNDIVQANQLAYLPFARSERDKEVLFDRHPDLYDQIELSKQRRIDSMRLRSRLTEDEDRFANAKLGVGSLERTASSPLSRGHMPTPADVSPVITPSPSPAIVAVDGTDDMPFVMDDEDPRLLPAPASPLDNSSSPQMPPRRQGSLAPAPPREAELGASAQSTPLDKRSADHDAVLLLGGPESSTKTSNRSTNLKLVWQSSHSNIQKIDLKNIMEQDSATRVSNLTQEMQKMSTSTKSLAKVSQKERKRQQQQQVREQEAKDQPTAQVPSKTGSVPSPSPWQTVAKPMKTTVPQVPHGNGGGVDMVTPVPVKPSMTMRQTVAAASPSPSTIGKGSSRGAPFMAPTLPSKAVAPQIQSIRHSPVLSSTSSSIDARASMADILAQQQTEKAAIKEAVAKKSLQEIQQEQEFQEWWDNESRRIQEEESQAAASSSRSGKGGRGQSGNRRGGSGKGRPAKTAAVSQETASSTSAKTSEASGRGGSRGHRSNERGKSRGQAGTQQRGARQP